MITNKQVSTIILITTFPISTVGDLNNKVGVRFFSSNVQNVYLFFNCIVTIAWYILEKNVCAYIRLWNVLHVWSRVAHRFNLHI